VPEITPVESDDRGLSGWVVAGFVVLVVMLVSVPAWFGIRAALEADWSLFETEQADMTQEFDGSSAGLSMSLPTDWVVYPLYDGETREASYRGALETHGSDVEVYLRDQVAWAESVSGTRVLVAWNPDDRFWLTVGRWPRSQNDYPDYVLNDLTQEALHIEGTVQSFDAEIVVAGMPGVRGHLTGPWADRPSDFEQHWYVVWADSFTFRFIFTFDEKSDYDRDSTIRAMESVEFHN
jgi:hypothetical protein